MARFSAFDLSAALSCTRREQRPRLAVHTYLMGIQKAIRQRRRPCLVSRAMFVFAFALRQSFETWSQYREHMYNVSASFSPKFKIRNRTLCSLDENPRIQRQFRRTYEDNQTHSATCDLSSLANVAL